jgi:hypothetical protein
VPETTSAAGSLWLDSAPSSDYPTLEGEAEVDVAIIGGGVAGLTTALLLKRGGALPASVLKALGQHRVHEVGAVERHIRRHDPRGSDFGPGEPLGGDLHPESALAAFCP